MGRCLLRELAFHTDHLRVVCCSQWVFYGQVITSWCLLPSVCPPTSQHGQGMAAALDLHPIESAKATARRSIYSIYRRSRALSALPGPKYPWLLGMTQFLRTKEPHRLVTELVEQYGPIFKMRVMSFHVRCLHAYQRLHVPWLLCSSALLHALQCAVSRPAVCPGTSLDWLLAGCGHHGSSPGHPGEYV